MQKSICFKIILIITMLLFLITVGGCGGGGEGDRYHASPTLSNLQLSSGTLNPEFRPARTQYTVSVANSVTTINITPTTASANASISINDVNVTSGRAGTVNLNVGGNTIIIIVENSAGSTSYTVTVIRDSSVSSPTLSGLQISSGTLNPAFNPATTQYTATVINAVNSITVTPTTASANASIKVNGVNVGSGNASGAINLNVGANTITIVVENTANLTTYTLTITRALYSATGYWTDVAETSWWDAASNDISFTLSTPQQLAGFAKLVNNRTANFSGVTVTLSGSINLSGREWEPIAGSFRGILDGNDNVISNMKISSNYDSVGLFGTLETTGTIKNLKLTNVDINIYPG